MPNRKWDVSDWYANIERARSSCLDWQPRTDFEEGLQATAAWYKGWRTRSATSAFPSSSDWIPSTASRRSIACYKDGQAIPIMYRRLKAVFEKLNIEYEIIFVNDNSPDDSEEVIRGISRNDRRVLGISHSRNFGSQAAFRSGMELATKERLRVVGRRSAGPAGIDRDSSWPKWREGYDVVYGRRVKRVAPLWMQIVLQGFSTASSTTSPTWLFRTMRAISR